MVSSMGSQFFSSLSPRPQAGNGVRFLAHGVAGALFQHRDGHQAGGGGKGKGPVPFLSPTALALLGPVLPRCYSVVCLLVAGEVFQVLAGRLRDVRRHQNHPGQIGDAGGICRPDVRPGEGKCLRCACSSLIPHPCGCRRLGCSLACIR